MQYYLELNNPGSGSLAVHRYSAGATDLAIGKLIRVNYRGQERGGFFIENVDYDQVKSGEHAQELKKVTGRGAMAVLDDGIVYPAVAGDGNRTFTSMSMAEMLLTLISEAKARGCFPSLRTDFSAELDSNGDPWTDVSTLTFNLDISLLDMVGQLVDLGLEFDFRLDWVLGDYVLYAYQTAIGSDVADSVVFRPGVNCVEVGHKQDSGELKNALRVSYTGGVTEISDATSIAAYRRREAPLQTANATSSGGAQLLANPQLTAKKDPRMSISVKLEDGTHNPRAFVDYKVGDWVGFDDPDSPGVAPVKYRVRGMMLDWGEDRKHAQVTVELNSIKLERELQNAIALRKLGNGVVGSSTSSAMPEGVAAAISTHNSETGAHSDRVLSGGDLTGSLAIPTVAKLRGRAIKNPLTLLDRNLLFWNEASEYFEPGFLGWTEIQDKPSTFTPNIHASSHASGGGDAVKLDDLAAPDDNTDLDASTSKHGLMKKFPGGTTDFLRADGAFATPPGGGGGGGDVYGSASVTDGHLAVFDVDGYHIKDGGEVPSGGGSGSSVISQSGTEVTLSNSTTETTVHTGPTIAGGSIGAHGVLRLKILFDLAHQTTCTTTIRVKLGSTTVATVAYPQGVTDVNKPSIAEILIANLGAENSQRYAYAVQYNDGSGKLRTGNGSGAADTSGDLALTVTVQHSVANANNLYKQYYIIIEQQ